MNNWSTFSIQTLSNATLINGASTLWKIYVTFWMEWITFSQNTMGRICHNGNSNKGNEEGVVWKPAMIFLAEHCDNVKANLINSILMPCCCKSWEQQHNVTQCVETMWLSQTLPCSPEPPLPWESSRDLCAFFRLGTPRRWAPDPPDRRVWAFPHVSSTGCLIQAHCPGLSPAEKLHTGFWGPGLKEGFSWRFFSCRRGSCERLRSPRSAPDSSCRNCGYMAKAPDPGRCHSTRDRRGPLREGLQTCPLAGTAFFGFLRGGLVVCARHLSWSFTGVLVSWSTALIMCLSWHATVEREGSEHTELVKLEVIVEWCREWW